MFEERKEIGIIKNVLLRERQGDQPTTHNGANIAKLNHA